MQRISAQNARMRLGELLDRVALRSEEFIIDRDGRPMAAVVSLRHLEHLRSWSRALMAEATSKVHTFAETHPFASTSEETEDEIVALTKQVRRARKKAT